VTDFISDILNDDSVSNTVSIIPFSIGVPVILPGENIAGGVSVGCSFVGKLKPQYQKVDLDFWYNKFHINNSNTPSEKAQSYSYDRSLYSYYQDVIGPATGNSMDNMITKGWCVKMRIMAAAWVKMCTAVMPIRVQGCLITMMSFLNRV
jgi:hypothetical protein